MSDSVFHLLLIGVDRYDRALKHLKGCVNDIDAIERLFMEEPGVGYPRDRIRVTRLESNLGEPASRGPEVVRGGATREDVLNALEELADSVERGDRVHIHYSGHGGQYAWKTDGVETGTWLEGLRTSDGDWVTDQEVNAWVHELASKTDDVTVVLDCCHSSGVSRGARAEDDADSATRGGSGSEAVAPPEASRLRLPSRGLAEGRTKRPGAPYVVLAACLAHEEAQEKKTSDGVRNGMLTYSFVKTVSTFEDPEVRAALRWGDLWPDLLETAANAAAEAPTVKSQQPWLIGRPGRRVFGGPWENQDLGYSVKLRDGKFVVRAGTLMGITEGARLAVYGPEPSRFPEIGSEDDLSARVGVLVVDRAGRTTSTAVPSGTAFELPASARCRLVKPVEAERLRVRLETMEEAVVAALRESPRLHVLEEGADEPECTVTGSSVSGWVILNDLELSVASCPAEEVGALRKGLEQYASYNQVLRLAHSCVDIELQSGIDVRFLAVGQEDARNAAELSGTEFAAWLKGRPELPRQDGVYVVPPDTVYVPTAENLLDRTLRLFLFCCTAAGQAMWISEMELRSTFTSKDGTEQPGQRDVFWFRKKRGESYRATIGDADEEMDRWVVVGTTALDAELQSMGTDTDVQTAIHREVTRSRGVEPARSRGVEPASPPEEPNPELWVASIIPLVILRSLGTSDAS